MKKCYERMYNIIRPLYRKGEVITKTGLWHRLSAYYLLQEFENVYTEDCKCSGVWSFFDFNDRFSNFANALCKEKYIIKIDRGQYQVINY